eukprot:gnl/TRDRNA2_/TRDRNA2_191399_c0_seq1.p1 gnl/TRDRNA2_/TRDRNA2_191399_c0~~gnl/TRDRNA2_/TRDRNA2_191399_c0_seq1.p1  ORF type:complete len:226 (+),score=48.87 gnl/TRDRNA2_/TRDRNA2_191399_c0_seq1:61-738(+)
MTKEDEGAEGEAEAAEDAPEVLLSPSIGEGDFPTGETPLETAWTFWVDKKSTDRKEQAAYMEGLKQIGTFNTMEGFFRLFACIKRPSGFPRDYSLLCFRKGCKPMWEEWPAGGCWNYRMRRTADSDAIINRSWESTVLACLGESFETPDVIGCVLSSRLKEVAVSVWNASNTRDSQVRFKIGEQMRQVLELTQNALLEYKDNQSCLKDFSGYRNARVYVMRPGES